MSDAVHWVVELVIKPGKFEEFLKLKEVLIASASEESGTFNYEWNLSQDQKLCHVYERYVDSEAAMIHSRTFEEKFAEQVLSIVDVAKFHVYGNPNDEVKETLSEFGAVFMSVIGGFSR